MAAYQAAKQRIYQHCSLAVVNQDDSATWTNKQPQVSFSVQQNADYCYQAGDLVFSQEGRLPSQDLPIKGLHNMANVLAAAALCRPFLAEPLTASNFATFTGLVHRCQLVHQSQNVRFIDDYLISR